MKSTVWKKAIKASADPARAEQVLSHLLQTSADPFLENASPDQARVLASLFSGSESLSTWLIAHPEHITLLDIENLRHPRRKEGMENELRATIKRPLADQDYTVALRLIREFKQRQMLRIGTRDLAGLADVIQVIQELSAVADMCLSAVWDCCTLQLRSRHGRPFHQDADGQWQPTTACVLGMGKLGGQELNYSSDVDVLFVYAEEGGVYKTVPGNGPASRPLLTNHQFHNKLAEAFIAEVSRMAPEGVLYRIDLRLRPEGDTSPLTRSLASYENYYAQWGQTWERMMLIKARGVAGEEGLAAEFLETVQPFRYPRSVNENVLREVAAMKERIELEVVKSGELDRNVKLGRGGIREIEFVAQSLQLLHAGRQPFLQGPQTLPCLRKLADYERLPRTDARKLHDAYCFLRALEHRLQMEANLQTHTIPTNRVARERLSRLMGSKTVADFESALRLHTTNTRAVFETVLKFKTEQPNAPSPFPRQFEGAEQEWKRILGRHGFKDVARAYRVLREFVEGPGYVHVSPRTTSLAYELLPRLFALCPSVAGTGAHDQRTGRDRIPLSDPDRVVTRLDSFIAAYRARATLFELWNSNPAIFELLLLLFDRSEFLAELAIRSPDLVDELVTSGRLRQRKTAEETLRDLRHGLGDEDQHLWLRRYHQAELMRIGLRDILGLADFEQYLTELSALADACLQYALEVVTRKNRLKNPPFAIIGLGKLGGSEIDYGSDLDILFVAPAKAKGLRKLAPMALQVTDLLSKRTEQGLLFQTDSRLRPDGEKGLLVTSLAACHEYYQNRAQLWEIQSLTRTRFIAGNSEAGAQFQALAATLTNFGAPPKSLNAFVPDWKQRIHQMRMRIEKERTPAGKDDLAIKTGTGGLMDAEFIAQSLCLEQGWREANTLRALDRGKAEAVLTLADQLIQNYRELRRIEGILRRWSYEGETVLPDDPAPFYRVSVRCGFSSPEAFREALKQCRTAIRQAYVRVFPFPAD